MFTGVHVLSPALLERLPPDGGSCVVRQGYVPALRDGLNIQAFYYSGYFQEHSTPARYLDGNRAVLRGDARLRHPPPVALVGIDPAAEVDPGAVVVAPVRIGPGARVAAGAVIGPESVVGSGARVGAGAHVARSVVWSGAAVERDAVIEDAVVTPRGVHNVQRSPSP